MANVSVVGASGIVGKELLKLLEVAEFSISKLTIYGSDRSYKNLVNFREEKIPIKKLSNASFAKDELVFFCTPSKISQKYVPLALENNSYVIDLSSAYRDDSNACLCIPEITQNFTQSYKLFSSPNCVASILSLALFPLHKLFDLKTVIASTYQAVSGGGHELFSSLIEDTKLALGGKKEKSTAFNVYLHNSKTFDDGYNFEEKKIISELKKILNHPNLLASVTSVRVPSLRCHSISCNLTFHKKVEIKDAFLAIESMQGVKIINEPPFASCNDAQGQHDIFCSRIRKIPFDCYGLELWVVGDQLLKGAALNAYQIAKKLIACRDLGGIEHSAASKLPDA